MADAEVDATTPLLSDTHTNETDREARDSISFDRVGLICLLVQHLSSAWGVRTAEFALYLYLIVYFRDTLLPSSILGFSMTATGILFSRWAGSLVDRYSKLNLVRSAILVQKISALLAYVSFIVMLSLPTPSQSPGRHSAGLRTIASPAFVTLVVSSCIMHLSNTSISIAVERDWASCLAHGPHFSAKLSKLNTYLRQINLLCKLCAPLFVSLLTVKFDDDQPSEDRTGGGIFSVRILAGVTALSLFFELYWIGVVYRRFPALKEEQQRKDLARRSQLPQDPELLDLPPARSPATNYLDRLLNIPDWKELRRLPIFFSSLSISLLYLTVLSFDGIMVGYLKTISYSDDFIAEMRGVGVITGLMGTALASPLERKIGSVRAGNWSIWSMVLTLVPVIVSFFIFAPRDSTPKGSTLGVAGAILLFGGMALSRIGLWSFDLIQTKQLQTALDHHPRRNTLTALQYTMQSVADLAKFVMTMILWQPLQFKWAATVSFTSVSMGAIVYMVYVKKERGHIAHLPIKMEWLKKIL
ncbi:hypothetical protein BDW22DRAFT_1415496 [Trametopsis cervina]|nr:hypothetical protein BDW22DRAFT_1415496 [Trametopsis cervina]